MNLLDAQEFCFHMDCNIICGSFSFDYTGEAAKPDFLWICPVGLKECVIISDSLAPLVCCHVCSICKVSS